MEKLQQNSKVLSKRLSYIPLSLDQGRCGQTEVCKRACIAPSDLLTKRPPYSGNCDFAFWNCWHLLQKTYQLFVGV